MGGAFFVGVIIYCIICGAICKAIASSRGMEGGFWWGFWLNIIGIIIVAVRPNDNKPAYVNTTNTASTPSLRQDSERDILADGGWKCDCGKVNYKYVSSCSCGRSKWDVEQRRYSERLEAEKAAVERVAVEKAAAEKKTEEGKAIPSCTQTTNNLTVADIAKYLKDYKELLDAEVLTDEEFERKKAQLLQNLAIDTNSLSEVEVIKHLKDYKELLDTSILTPKEFEEVKRELLQDEEQKQLEAQRRKEEEQKRLEEQRRVEEQKRFEEQRRIEEQKRLEEQRRLEEEQKRLEELRKIEEQKRLEEERRKEEEQRRLEELNGIAKFICTSCGATNPGWYQKCPNCGAVGNMKRNSEEEQKRFEEHRREAEEQQKKQEEQLRLAELNKKTKFICTSCGATNSGWYQKCPNCGAIGNMKRNSEEEQTRYKEHRREVEELQQSGFFANIPHIFYCKNCGTALGGISNNRPEKCDKCGSSFFETSIARDVWRSLSSEQKLQALLDDGAINQEEYNAKKAKLLG